MIKSMDRRRQRIYTGVLAITALCTQYTAVVMSTPVRLRTFNPKH
jgi:hypothetical protein